MQDLSPTEEEVFMGNESLPSQLQGHSQGGGNGSPHLLCHQWLPELAWAGENSVLKLIWFHLPM